MDKTTKKKPKKEKEPKKLLKMEDLHDFKDRMSFVVQLHFTSKADAAEQLELSQQMISGLTNGKTKPSFDTILQIHKIIPDLNLHWLLLGKGDMEQNPQTNKQADANTQIIEEPKVGYGATQLSPAELLREKDLEIHSLRGEIKAYEKMFPPKKD